MSITGLIRYFTQGGNFGLVAANLTYAFTRLKAAHAHRFTYQRDMLTAAAVINASYFVLRDKIAIAEIESLHENCTGTPVDHQYLTDFVCAYVGLYLYVSTPGSGLDSALKLAFNSKRIHIQANIDRVVAEAARGYCDPLWRDAVDAAITSPLAPIHPCVLPFLGA